MSVRDQSGPLDETLPLTGSPEPSESAAPVAGFELMTELGQGGIGTVWRSRDLGLDRTVAIKTLRRRFQRDPAARQRFQQEARIGGGLQHPGIIPIYSAGTLADERPFIAMRLIEGESLAEMLDQPDIRLARLLRIFTQICHAVGYAHSQGVIHRDLKPANVMVGRHGEVQVVDWGLASVCSGSSENWERQGSAGREESESIVGSPAYMPPEQARGRPDALAPSCDVFSLGAILCQILTGTPPYQGTTSERLRAAARADLDQARERIRQSPADSDLQQLALKCLQADPGQRPADASALASLLDDYLSRLEETAEQARIDAARAQVRAGEETRRRRLWVGLASTALLLVVGAFSVFLGWQDQAMKRRETLRADLQSALSELQQRVLLAVSRPLGNHPDWKNFQPILDRVEGLVEDPQLDDRTRLAALPELERARGQIHDREMLERLEDLLIEGATNSDRTSWQRMDENYERAFRDYGIDVWEIPFETAVERVRSSPLRTELADALELWMSTRSVAQRFAPSETPRTNLQTWLSLILEVDDDPLRSRRRRSMYGGRIDLTELRSIRDATDFEQSTPRSLSWLASAFSSAGSTPEALEILREASLRYPSDAMLRDDYALTLLASNSGKKPCGTIRPLSPCDQ